MPVLALLGIGIAIGLVLGLLGGGGAILAVPGLVYVLGIEPHAAIAASLAIVAAGALTGLLVHARRGRVAWLLAVQLGLTGAAGSLAGARLGQLLPGEQLLALLGLFMLLAAGMMVRRLRVHGEHTRSGRWLAPLMGLGLGLLTGFFGVGGGFLIVPALTIGLGLPIGQAIGTSLAVITMNALAGIGGYVGSDAADWSLTGLLALGAAIGALVGSRLVGVVPERGLRHGFAGMVALIAVYLVYRNATSWVVALVLSNLRS